MALIESSSFPEQVLIPETTYRRTGVFLVLALTGQGGRSPYIYLFCFIIAWGGLNKLGVFSKILETRYLSPKSEGSIELVLGIVFLALAIAQPAGRFLYVLLFLLAAGSGLQELILPTATR